MSAGESNRNAAGWGAAPLGAQLHTAALIICAMLLGGCFEDANGSLDDGETGSSSESGFESDGMQGPTTSATGGSTTGATDETGESGGPGGGACGPAAQCLPTPPHGWTGPVALAHGADGDDHLACPDQWVPQPEVWRYDVPEHECSCGCGAFAGDCTVSVTEFPDTDPGCTGAGQDFSVGDACVELAQETTAHRVTVATPEVANAACPPVQGDPPPPIIAEPITMCGAPAIEGSCYPGTCVPNPPPAFDRICIVSPDAEECPAGLIYSDPVVVHESVSDTRECPTCSCLPDHGASCTGILSHYTDPSCVFGAAVVLFNTACQPLNTAEAGLLRLDLQVLDEPTGSCSPDPGPSPTLTGEATPAGRLLACCVPD